MADIIRSRRYVAPEPPAPPPQRIEYIVEPPPLLDDERRALLGYALLVVALVYAATMAMSWWRHYRARAHVDATPLLIDRRSKRRAARIVS
jgi:hypothetical protein